MLAKHPSPPGHCWITEAAETGVRQLHYPTRPLTARLQQNLRASPEGGAGVDAAMEPFWTLRTSKELGVEGGGFFTWAAIAIRYLIG